MLGSELVCPSQPQRTRRAGPQPGIRAGQAQLGLVWPGPSGWDSGGPACCWCPHGTGPQGCRPLPMGALVGTGRPERVAESCHTYISNLVLLWKRACAPECYVVGIFLPGFSPTSPHTPRPGHMVLVFPIYPPEYLLSFPFFQTLSPFHCF